MDAESEVGYQEYCRQTQNKEENMQTGPMHSHNKQILDFPGSTKVKFTCNGEVHYALLMNVSHNSDFISILTDNGDRVDFPIANTVMTVFKV